MHEAIEPPYFFGAQLLELQSSLIVVAAPSDDAGNFAHLSDSRQGEVDDQFAAEWQGRIARDENSALADVNGATVLPFLLQLELDFSFETIALVFAIVSHGPLGCRR